MSTITQTAVSVNTEVQQVQFISWSDKINRAELCRQSWFEGKSTIVETPQMTLEEFERMDAEWQAANPDMEIIQPF